MNRAVRVRAVLIVLMLAGFAHAQITKLPPPQGMVKVLVPVKTGDFPGVGGSLWRDELWIHNDNDVEVNVFRLQWAASPCPPYCGGISPSPLPDRAIPPHSTVQVASSQPVIANQLAEFFYVDRSLASRVFFQLRTHDEARNFISAGTEIPVVTETAARHKLEFLSIPVASNFRYMLRIYTFGADLSVPPANRIRFFDAQTNSLLLETPLQFNGFEDEGPTNYTVTPYPNAIPLDLSGDPNLASVKFVRVEVESAFYMFWAFLTLTNNTSNEVTVVSPWAGT